MIQMTKKSSRRALAVGATVSVAALMLSACSSSSEDTATSETTTAGASESTESGAVDCVIGFSNPTASNTYLGPLMDAMQKTVENRGGTFLHYAFGNVTFSAVRSSIHTSLPS